MNAAQPDEAKIVLTITHTAIDGTVLEGTDAIYGTPSGTRVAEILKSDRWRWYRTGQFWFIPKSRDHAPKSWMITRTAEELQNAGFEVNTQIDTTKRPTAEVEADLIARQEQRVEGLAEKATKREASAVAAHERADELSSMLPLGQPILVGHHSERKMRRHFERIDSTTRAAFAAQDEAAETRRRADAAAETTAGRYAPLTVARRMKRLETLHGRVQRNLERYENKEDATASDLEFLDRVAKRNKELVDELAYWQGIRRHQIEAGDVVDYSREMFAKDDQVLYLDEWLRVVRVNAKSVTVIRQFGSGTVPYEEIRGHRAAEK